MALNTTTAVPLLFEQSKPGRCGVELPDCDVPEQPLDSMIPQSMLRTDLPLPELAEPAVIRHYTNLSQRTYSIDSGFYPLGSCTMKYNPKLHEDAARLPGFARLHPNTPDELAQGALELMYDMQGILAEIAGMDAVSLQPAAGAHGELLGLMLIRAYLDDHGEAGARDTILVPEAAHGTNPASAARCGYKTVSVKSDDRGRTDVEHLKTLLGDHVAGLMLTNPNTLGLFEDSIQEITDLIHSVGGLVYCDGANMNALVGRARPGDMGFDVMHYNLHKTFSSPHGGGGPGSGPVAVKQILEPYLPVPMIRRRENADGTGEFFRDYDNPKTVGRIASYQGSFMAMMRAYLLILYYGRENLKAISENAVLNANYVKARLQDVIPPAYDQTCMHEVVLSARQLVKDTGVKAYDIAKRLMDYGYHPPTIYFPLIAPEALMIEPTETENKETLDAFCDALQAVVEEARNQPDLLHDAPLTMPVRRLDEATAARQPNLRWQPAS